MRNFEDPLDVDRKRVAAHLLLVATQRLFPEVILCGSGVTSLGFFADFIFSSPLSENLLELIEREMIGQVKKELPVRSLSMMRENAQEMFSHFGHDCLADAVSEREENVVELLLIDDLYSISPPVSITSLCELGSFKLFRFHEQQEDREYRIRIEGVVKENAFALKTFLKAYHAFLKKKDHRMLGPQLKLFEFCDASIPFEVIWTSRGIKLKEILLSWVTSLFPDKHVISTPKLLNCHSSFFSRDQNQLSFEGFEETYFFRGSPQKQHKDYLESLKLCDDQLPFSLFERATSVLPFHETYPFGLFNCCLSEILQITTLCQEHQVSSSLISSLHSIEQIITMFALKAEWVLTLSEKKHSWRTQKSLSQLKEVFEAYVPLGNISKNVQQQRGCHTCLELLIHDCLGRKWPLANLSIEAFDPSFRRFVVLGQCLSSIETFIALLIEETEGNLPLWLVPEQFRIFAIGENNQSYAREVMVFLEKQGLRGNLETSKVQLGQSLRQAEKEMIPYVLFVGERERLERKVTLSAANSRGVLMDVEEFVNRHRNRLKDVN